MKCGSCKDDHETVAQVKLCYQRNKGITAQEEQPLRPGDPGFKPSQVRHRDERTAQLAELNRVGLGVPPGRYALPNGQGAINKHSFYVVERADFGNWAGKTFVKRYKSDEQNSVPVAQAIVILTRIAADPQGYMTLFGKLEEHCGHCGRRLTNDVSRERGIGPKCAQNMGWTDVA
jgi:hypothetical protein